LNGILLKNKFLLNGNLLPYIYTCPKEQLLRKTFSDKKTGHRETFLIAPLLSKDFSVKKYHSKLEYFIRIFSNYR
jgi:hypothetical protein